MKNNSKHIPQIVRNAVDSDYTIEYLGEKNGAHFYNAYIADAKAGFPMVIQLFKNEILVLEDDFARSIISSFW